MKKIILVLSFLNMLCINAILAQYNDTDGMYINVNLAGSKPSRPGMEKYLDVLSDSLLMNSGFNAKPGYGVDLSVTFRKDETEFVMGGTILKSGYSSSGNQNGTNPSISCSDISIHMGLNYFPIHWIIVGGEIVANAEQDNKLKDFNSTSVSSPENTTNLNIFRGYSMGLKVLAGLNLPLNEDRTASLRITPFYHLGLSKYNFYDNFDNYLTHFNGDKKSRFSQAGLLFGIAFRFR